MHYRYGLHELGFKVCSVIGYIVATRNNHQIRIGTNDHTSEYTTDSDLKWIVDYKYLTISFTYLVSLP